MAPERSAALAVVICCGFLLVLAVARRPSTPEPPPRIAASACEPWMADALPGIGAKSLPRAVDAIRSNDLSKLPPAARREVAELFEVGR